MQIELTSRPAGSAARVRLDHNESLTAEVGAMIACTEQVDIDTTTRSKGGGGGIMKGVKRMLGGENLFLNHFTANAPDQEVIVGPALVGDVIHHQLDNATMICQGDAWLASSEGIEIDATWRGFGKALFSGESMFWVRCSGSGDLLLNSFGAIYEIEVDGSYTVDTGHIVAFEETLDFKIGKSNDSLLGSFLGGEGLVCKFAGHGKLYCQTHNPPSFGQALGPSLRPRR